MTDAMWVMVGYGMAEYEQVPLDSGSAKDQKAQPATAVAAIAPCAQLSEVAETVTRETSGLVQLDPMYLQQSGAQRILASYLNELSASREAANRNLNSALERERALASDLAMERADHAVAKSALQTEQSLRRPRAVVGGLGTLVFGLGVDQYADGRQGLGIVLGLLGVTIVIAATILGMAKGAQA